MTEPVHCVAKIQVETYTHECECTLSRNHHASVPHVCIICGAWWEGNRLIRPSPYLG